MFPHSILSVFSVHAHQFPLRAHTEWPREAYSNGALHLLTQPCIGDLCGGLTPRGEFALNFYDTRSEFLYQHWRRRLEWLWRNTQVGCKRTVLQVPYEKLSACVVQTSSAHLYTRVHYTYEPIRCHHASAQRQIVCANVKLSANYSTLIRPVRRCSHEDRYQKLYLHLKLKINGFVTPFISLSLSGLFLAAQLALLLTAAVLPSLALYDKSDDVYELTADNFDTMVINSPHVWVVEFYAPW